MGDAADDAIEQGLMQELDADLYGTEEDGDGFGPAFGYRKYPSFNGKCKYCGEGGLHWGKTKLGKWRLYSGTKMHSCRQKQSQKKDIETLSDLVKFTHWKVGDGMRVGKEMPYDEDQGFCINQIAVVQEKGDPSAFQICYFDDHGKCRGHQNVKLINTPTKERKTT